MSSGRLSLRYGAVVLPAALPFALAVLLGLVSCTRAVDGVPTAAPAAATPRSADDLEAMLVSTVPSGLPRLPDDHVRPPAGPKDVGDVAEYSTNPLHEREVLEDYGYRYGWERFWGSEAGPMTSVFVDQFDHRAGAATYAADLALNEARVYGAILIENSPDLPGGCRLLTVDAPDPGTGLRGPAALAWCGHGVFSVSATAVADSVDAAEEEVRGVIEEQLARLPPR